MGGGRGAGDGDRRAVRGDRRAVGGIGDLGMGTGGLVRLGLEIRGLRGDKGGCGGGQGSWG